ncbi:MAG: hypothetical protein F6K41_27885 [Symploca sp. SIO3E6]|nr:hypothetical protein [Caldora sp. SIO3E6]
MIAMVKQWTRYWMMERIDPATGRCKNHKIDEARTFFLEKFPTLVDQPDILDTDDESIQEKLWELCRASEPSIRAMAALNLRCYISDCVKYACIIITQDYGTNPNLTYPLTCEDLFPYVLDDQGKLLYFILENEPRSLEFVLNEHMQLMVLQEDGTREAMYRPFSFEVLGTFDAYRQPRYSLKNWTILKVKRSKKIDEVLREHGIIRQSFWRLLKITTPKQLQYLEELHHFSVVQIQWDVELLTCLQNIYQEERLRQREAGVRSSSRKYLDPGHPLMKSMFSTWHSSKSSPASVKDLVTELKRIAKFLAQHKANKAGNSELPPLSLDAKPGEFQSRLYEEWIPHSRFPNDLAELERRVIEKLQLRIQERFKPVYQEQFISFLDQAIEYQIIHRFNYLQSSRRNAHKAPQYIPGLRYFYCAGMSLGEIALRMNLKSQPQVSRLLELKNLFTDVEHQLLEQLREFVLDWVRNQGDAEYRQLLAQVEELQLWEDKSGLWIQLLYEQIKQIKDLYQEAQAEIYHPQSHARNSLVAQRIRVFLNNHSSKF